MKVFKTVLRVSRKMALMALPTLVGTVPGTLWAGTNVWANVGPEGGPILALSIDPHNPATIYAATNYGGAFKSVDRGANWVKSNTPNRGLIFDPQDPNTMYGMDARDNPTCDGISKSTDGGASWNPANSGLPTAGGSCVQVRDLAIDPRNPFTLYAGTYGIYKSTDGGANWSLASSGLPKGYGRYPLTSALVIDPQNPSTVYALVEHFDAPGVLLFKSTDGGGSWNSAGLGLPESSIILAIDPQNPTTLYAGTHYGIFKSADGGASWSPVNAGLPWFDTGPSILVYSVAVDPQQPEMAYAAVGNLLGGKVFKTTNGGASWSDASSGLPGGTYFRVLTIDTRNPATLYTGTVSGVFKSTDGGTSWSAADSGLTATLIWDLAIDPQNPGTFYAATAGGLLKTTDAGTTWSTANSGLASSGSPLAIDLQNASTIFVAGGAVDASGGSAYGVFKSTDGGASWSPSWIAGDSYSNWVTALAIDPQNSNTVYATTQGFDECDRETLHKSVDSGMSWADFLFKDLGVSASCVLALVIDPQSPGTLYAAFEYGGVFKSTDGGASWSTANSGLSPIGGSFSAVALAIDPRNPSTLYAVSPRGSSWGAFKSNDGGASWNPAGSGLPDWSSGMGDCCYRPRLAVDPQNPDRVYLGAALNGMQRVFQSADGAATWSDSGLAVPGPGEWFGGLAVSSQGPSTVYAGTPGEGVFAMSNEVTTRVQ